MEYLHEHQKLVQAAQRLNRNNCHMGAAPQIFIQRSYPSSHALYKETMEPSSMYHSPQVWFAIFPLGMNLWMMSENDGNWICQHERCCTQKEVSYIYSLQWIVQLTLLTTLKTPQTPPPPHKNLNTHQKIRKMPSCQFPSFTQTIYSPQTMPRSVLSNLSHERAVTSETIELVLFFQTWVLSSSSI